MDNCRFYGHADWLNSEKDVVDPRESEEKLDKLVILDILRIVRLSFKHIWG
jgi:hypothetical protein